MGFKIAASKKPKTVTTRTCKAGVTYRREDSVGGLYLGVKLQGWMRLTETSPDVELVNVVTGEFVQNQAVRFIEVDAEVTIIEKTQE